MGTYILKALALMDNVFLVTYVCMTLNFIISNYYNMSVQYCAAFQTYVFPLAYITEMWVVWMIVIVAGNRYIAVCRPLDAPRLCTKCNVQLQIVIMAGAVCVWNIPRFLETRFVEHNVAIVDNNMTLWNETWQDVGIANVHMYNILYKSVSYHLFIFVLPLVIIIYFNVHIMHGLKVAQRGRSTMACQSNNDENNITLVMIVIIIAFIVCQTPAIINHILYKIIDQVPLSKCTPYTMFFQLSNLFILINSSLNFVIYFLIRKQFQHQLRMLFGRTCRSPSQ